MIVDWMKSMVNPLPTDFPVILFFCEDRQLLPAFEEFFGREHCRMLSAATLEEATRVLSATRIALVVLDLQRVTTTVHQVIAACRTAHPGMPLLVLGGDACMEQLQRLDVDAVLFKPLELESMRGTVRKLLAAAQTHA